MQKPFEADVETVLNITFRSGRNFTADDCGFHPAIYWIRQSHQAERATENIG